MDNYKLNEWFLNKEEKKMGLVLGGGGARGCYEIGVWQALAQAQIRFDVVSGTSIGAIVGAIYTQQTLKPLVEFVHTLKPTAIAQDLFDFPETFGQLIKERRQIQGFLDKYIYSNKGMDISPLKEALHAMFDYQLFHDSPIDFACMTFNATKRRPEAYFKREMTQENAEDIILASASCYPAFPMLEMQGQMYIDGGYWDNVPVDLARKMGAEKLLVVDVEGPGLVHPIWPSRNVLVMKPMLPLGNFLDFSEAVCERSMHIGYLDTCRLLNLYAGYLFTFTKDDLKDMAFVDGYLDFMFKIKDIQVPGWIPDWVVRHTVGFHPSALSRRMAHEAGFEKLVEALAYEADLDPAALYSYHYFIRTLLHRLAELRTDTGMESGQDGLEWMKTLSSQGLLALFHRLIREEEGAYTDYMQMLRHLFPSEFYLAWVWYFLEIAYERMDQ